MVTQIVVFGVQSVKNIEGGTMIENTYDRVQLVLTLIKSTCSYTLSHTGNKNNKDYYEKTMKNCYDICYSDNIDNIRQQLRAYKRQLPTIFRWQFYIIADPQRYCELAVDQCIDIINSIQTRFETGYSSPDDIFINGIANRRSYKNKSIFREIQGPSNFCNMGSRAKRS